MSETLLGVFMILGIIEVLFIVAELDFIDYMTGNVCMFKSIVIFVKGFFKNRNVFGYFLSLIAIVLLIPGLSILVAAGIPLELIIRGLSALWKAGDKK